MAKKDKDVTTEMPTDLPEAGYARREELRRRADSLMAEAEMLMAAYEQEAIDPAKVDPANIDREIRQAIDIHNEVYVSSKDANFVYAWIYRDPYNKYGGRYVRSMQALLGGTAWEIVRGDMKEAAEHKAVTGERWVADCLLMRCRLDRYAKLQLIDRERRARTQEGVTASFFESANRRGVRVFDQNTMPDHIRGYMESMASARHASRPPGAGIRQNGISVPPARVLRAQAARQLAMDKLNHQIREGTVAGLRPEDVAR